jgi:hypothetical protein
MEQICVDRQLTESLDLNCRNLLATRTSSCLLLKREGRLAFRQPAAVALKKEDPGRDTVAQGCPTRIPSRLPMYGWVLLYFQVTAVTREATETRLGIVALHRFEKLSELLFGLIMMRVRFEFESGIVLFCFSFIFVPFGESR